MPEHTLNIVLIEYESWWVAQCLQYDIGAQAHTLKDVLYEFERSLIGHMVICEELGTKPFADLPAAPRKYWRMWEDGSATITPEDMPAFRATPADKMPVKDIRIAA